MAKTYLDSVSGEIVQKIANDTSAGAGDAGKLIATDSSGRLPVTMLPLGVGQLVMSFPSFENLSAGNIVSLYNDTGTLKARKADCTNSLPCHGFVVDTVVAPAAVNVYFDTGIISGLVGLTIGARYYLSTAGAISSAAPSATGNLVQLIGVAVSTTQLAFDPKDYVKLA